MPVTPTTFFFDFFFNIFKSMHNIGLVLNIYFINLVTTEFWRYRARKFSGRDANHYFLCKCGQTNFFCRVRWGGMDIKIGIFEMIIKLFESDIQQLKNNCRIFTFQ